MWEVWFMDYCGNETLEGKFLLLEEAESYVDDYWDESIYEDYLIIEED